MKYLKQLMIILVICLIGEILARLLPIPFPGNIMAMLLLTGLLATKAIKESQIKETGNFLLELLGLTIIPVSVSVLDHMELVSQIWMQLLVISLIILVAVFASCALTIRLTSRMLDRSRKGGGGLG